MQARSEPCLCEQDSARECTGDPGRPEAARKVLRSRLRSCSTASPGLPARLPLSHNLNRCSASQMIDMINGSHMHRSWSSTRFANAGGWALDIRWHIEQELGGHRLCCPDPSCSTASTPGLPARLPPSRSPSR